jgi:HD-GYP domain-containing protein (c-di-GMP phosphodiesterase class II)
LKGDQIPRGARICALADVWDALLSERCYRAAWNPSQAVEYIWVRAGSLFDPKLACVFLNMMEAREQQNRDLPVRVPVRVALSGQISAVH